MAGATGTDRSQSDTAFANGTALTVDGTTNTDVAPDGYSPVAADVGNLIQITTTGTGAAFTVGFYQIASIVAGKWRLDRSPAATSSTGATWTMGGALATIAKVMTANARGNKIFLREGTYQTAATIACGTGGSLDVSSYSRLIGYYQVRGDIGQDASGAYVNNAHRPLIQLITNGSLMALSTTNAAWGFENLDVDCNNLAGSFGILATGAATYLFNCRVRNFKSEGIRIDRGMTVACEVSGGATGATCAIRVTTQPAYVSECYIHDNVCTGISCDNAGARTAQIVSCLIVNNTGATSDGLNIGEAGFVLDNTIVGNGRDGVRCVDANIFDPGLIRRNLFALNGGFGLNCSGGTKTPALPFWDGNAYYANTSGTRHGIDDTTGYPVNGVAPYTNLFDVILTADPFVAKASNDFRLNAVAGGGAACRGHGVPTGWPGNTLTTSAPDMGAAQSMASGGGVPMIGGGLVR